MAEGIKRKTRRTSSNVFHMFHKDQMGELRDAFSLFDADGDGKVTIEDLRGFCDSIGTPYTDAEMADMVEQIEPNYNFMMFLTHIGDRLSSLGDLHSIVTNFKNLDETNKGSIAAEKLQKQLEMNDDDFKRLTNGCIKNGEVDYYRLSVKIKYGEIIESEIHLKEEDEDY